MLPVLIEPQGKVSRGMRYLSMKYGSLTGDEQRSKNR